MRVIVAALILMTLGVPAAAGGCATTLYRRQVVGVLGTSEELLSTTNGAYKALKLGHITQARQALKDVHLYLPAYWDREGKLVTVTTGCGT